MSNDKNESISAKLRRVTDKGRYHFTYEALCNEFEVAETRNWDDLCNVLSKIADEIDREMDELRNKFRVTHPMQAVGDIAAGKEVYPLLREAIERYYLPRPLFEDGEPVQFGDTFVRDYGKDGTVSSLTYTKGNSDYVNINGYERHDFDHRLKRPKPQVLDADGVECCIGETVYRIDKVAGTSDNPLVIDKVTHDGTLWWKGGRCAPARLFTHRKPTILDADGVPIEVGDKVYLVPGEHCNTFPLVGYDSGTEYTVVENNSPGHRADGRICISGGVCLSGYPMPDQVTHSEPDSLEKLLERMEDYAQKNEGYVDGSKVGDFAKELCALIELDEGDA